MMGQDMREQIIAARKSGVTVRELSLRYGVSERSIYKLQAQYRQIGSVAPQTHTRGRKSKIDAKTLQKIEQIVQQEPNITLKELLHRLNLPICVSRLSQILRNKLGYASKKRWDASLEKPPR